MIDAAEAMAPILARRAVIEQRQERLRAAKAKPTETPVPDSPAAPLAPEDAIGRALDRLSKSEPYCDRYDLEASARSALGEWEVDNGTLPDDRADAIVQAAVTAALESRRDDLDHRTTLAALRRESFPRSYAQ